MGTNIATTATSPALIPAAVQAAGGKQYTDEQVRELVAALEEPFDPRQIKWRVTKTQRRRPRRRARAPRLLYLRFALVAARVRWFISWSPINIADRRR